MGSALDQLDRARAAADAADPLKPGMWGLDGKRGRYSGEWWDVMNRAGAKFSPEVPADEVLRYAGALAMAKEGAKP